MHLGFKTTNSFKIGIFLVIFMFLYDSIMPGPARILKKIFVKLNQIEVLIQILSQNLLVRSCVTENQTYFIRTSNILKKLQLEVKTEYLIIGDSISYLSFPNALHRTSSVFCIVLIVRTDKCGFLKATSMVCRCWGDSQRKEKAPPGLTCQIFTEI